jgi:hypothetical protein
MNTQTPLIAATRIRDAQERSARLRLHEHAQAVQHRRLLDVQACNGTGDLRDDLLPMRVSTRPSASCEIESARARE